VVTPATVLPGPGEGPAAFLERLASALSAALPDTGALTLERHRSVGDRIAGRPGGLRSVRVELPAAALTLRANGTGLAAGVERVVRGVTIARRDVAVGEFLELLAVGVADVTAAAAGDTAAAARALVALGLSPRADVLRVEEADPVESLRSLPARAADLLPAAAATLVARIAELLADTLTRTAQGSDARLAVERTAVHYLPDTLRAFAVLPPDWAGRADVAGARTPEELLQDQLTVLLDAVTAMHDAVVRQDASALVVNGLFLRDRFAVSSLDLGD
jgi:hypothetical protein